MNSRSYILAIGLVLAQPALANPKLYHIDAQGSAEDVTSAQGRAIMMAPAPAAQAGYNTLSVDEEFGGTEADLLQRWSVGLWYQTGLADDQALKVRFGQAELVARQEPFVRNTLLSTWSADGRVQNSYQFGYFEARMKWTATPGNWADFWLISEEAAKVPYRSVWPEYCEIDISEAFDGGYQSTVHDWLRQGSETNFSQQHYHRVYGFDPEQWHTYAALWQPGRISFYFDGKLVSSMVPPQVCNKQKMIIVIGANRHDNHRQPMSIDWVRVWQ